MGEVWRAEDVELARDVAIKVVRPALLDQLDADVARELRERLLQEAKAVARVEHPAIPAVHRVGSVQGYPYVVMAWVDGTPLDARLREDGALGLERSVRLGLEVLDALAVAHARGIIHRDIKPGNLMIAPDGHVVLLDFGIAKVSDPSAVHTHFGVVLGTPQYAAPEQLGGLSVDGRADLYAVGALLFECMTGHPPFEGNSLIELAQRVATAEVPSVRHYRASLPAKLDAFFARTLAKDPVARFPDAEAMGHALQAFLFDGTGRTGITVRSSRGDRSPLDAPSPPEAEPGAPRVQARTPGPMLVEWARGMPSRGLGIRKVRDVLARLLDVPLHAPAFTGALEVAGTTVWFHDGVALVALDRSGSSRGDLIVDTLPEQAPCTLYEPWPGDAEQGRALLPSLLAPVGGHRVKLANLDPQIVDLRRLVARLVDVGQARSVWVSGPGGSLILAVAPGAPVQFIAGGGWNTGATLDEVLDLAMTEGERIDVLEPSFCPLTVTFARRLSGARMYVERAISGSDDPHRTLHFEPDAIDPGQAETRFARLISCNPITEDARFLVSEAREMFARFDRVRQWAQLIGALEDAHRLLLHPPASLALGGASFDAIFLGAGGMPRVTLRRLTLATPTAMQAAIDEIARAVAHDRGRGPLDAAILVAKEFDEPTTDAYIDALRRSRSEAGLTGVLSRISDLQGRLFVGRRAIQVLLLVEQDGRRRPLMFA